MDSEPQAALVVTQRATLTIARDAGTAVLVGGASVLITVLVGNVDVTRAAVTFLFVLFIVLSALMLLGDVLCVHTFDWKMALCGVGVFVVALIVVLLTANWPGKPDSSVWWAVCALCLYAVLFGYAGRLVFQDTLRKLSEADDGSEPAG
jgi:hypothetical protein